MSKILGSLRIRVLLAVAGTLLVGSALAYASVLWVAQDAERRGDTKEAQRNTLRIADEVSAGAGQRRLRVWQHLLSDARLVVYQNGHVIFAAGAPAAAAPVITTSADVGGVRVVLHDGDLEEPTPYPHVAVLIAALIGLVTGAASFVGFLVSRGVKNPIDSAVGVAQRVASGDFSARVGDVGPAEFRQLARAFDGMASRLESADQEQRRFLADVAHEIATPLNVVSGFALAMVDGSVSTPEQQLEASAAISTQTERLNLLLQDLRLLNRLDLATPLRNERIDVVKLCGALTARFAVAAKNAGVTLTSDVSAMEWTSERRLIETVLDNLLSNAIRYTPRGGRVAVGAFRRRQDLVISVRDSGIGISQAHQERIFDRLYRTDNARDRNSGGSGLGLAIAQRSARALGGLIEVDSDLGKGSEFRLVVPPVPGPVSETDARSESQVRQA
ncbi:MAG: two-component system, OmpR family, sensor histidine kinase BaeS [Actinomycetota bacterium]|jgi:two-component system sensor histidine kinase BaeS|nr:two-component system, OmpR family, sensor histidine kinase BaeS [Actinomycetota bacterium]